MTVDMYNKMCVSVSNFKCTCKCDHVHSCMDTYTCMCSSAHRLRGCYGGFLSVLLILEYKYPGSVLCVAVSSARKKSV